MCGEVLLCGEQESQRVGGRTCCARSLRIINPVNCSCGGQYWVCQKGYKIVLVQPWGLTRSVIGRSTAVIAMPACAESRSTMCRGYGCSCVPWLLLLLVLEMMMWCFRKKLPPNRPDPTASDRKQSCKQSRPLSTTWTMFYHTNGLSSRLTCSKEVPKSTPVLRGNTAFYLASSRRPHTNQLHEEHHNAEDPISSDKYLFPGSLRSFESTDPVFCPKSGRDLRRTLFSHHEKAPFAPLRSTNPTSVVLSRWRTSCA